MRPSGQIWLRQRAGRNQWRPACMRQRMRWPGWGEVRQLRTRLLLKRSRRRFAAALNSAKEELEREFAAEREELEADYQKQVDDTFIFGYRCCMKKNGINEMSLQFLRVKRRNFKACSLIAFLFAIFL
ncbi:hypothetical protein CK203_100011 [Vitis vinifera]|uniref:Uncharacterized protein n=1 Tax=Vitis vinifera TaxID=29760 RepID=A0A438DI89_VITVI|nr:hypothetical protein CK203_100011 [Vitis vinifera]